MPDDNTTNNYEAIVAKVREQDAKIAELTKELKDVVDFNKALLATAPNDEHTTEEQPKVDCGELLDKYLKEKKL